MYVEKASPALDGRGKVDAVVHVVGGRLYLQLKSTEFRMQKFKKKHPDIPCLLVKIDYSKEKIFKDTMLVLEEEYRRFCSNHPRQVRPQEQPPAFA